MSYFWNFAQGNWSEPVPSSVFDYSGNDTSGNTLTIREFR